MYLLNDPEVVQALTSVAREGRVPIRLLIDSGMLAGSLLPHVQQLWDAGIAVHYYQKDRSALHLKTAVIDNRYVWTGTANWTTGALEVNAEDMLFFDSPDMARLVTAFLDGIQEFSQSFAPLSLGQEVAVIDIEPEVGPGGYLTGIPPGQPRAEFDHLLRDPAFPGFEVQAAVSYLPDGDYLPVLLNLIRKANQSILVAMFVMSETQTKAEAQEQLVRELERAAARGVYVYLLLHTPTSVNDRLDESHSNWAERLRPKGIDVRLNLPHIHLHSKMVVVDLAKVLIGSHNWSEGALSGKRVYESSVLLELPAQDIRFADYILSRQTIRDMRSRPLWEQEKSLLRQVVTMNSDERAAFLRDRKGTTAP
jgi:phosphatidylserine/phosphatidylglycerophosphate/cardiolipin synthase-like enzyme